MNTQQSSSLATLAMLKVNYDMQKRYVDIFLPFVLECFTNGETLSLELIQSSILNKRKLRIPLNSLISILSKAERNATLEKYGEYYNINKEKFTELNHTKASNEALREQKQLIQRLIEYCNREFRISLSIVDAENALFNYIRHRDIELLKSTVFGSPFHDDTTLPKRISYYIGQFIKHVSETDQDTFELLGAYLKSYMLSELLIFENVSDIDKPLSHIDFYLDTQFIFRVLGFTYPQLRRACNELKVMLYNEGCNLFVFRHTVEEITGVLDACEKTLRHDNPRLLGEVGRYCIDNRVTASDLRMSISSIEKLLQEHHIQVKEAPPHSSPEYEIGEKELTEYLNTHYKYRNPIARDRDVDSISAMYRLRRGKKPSSIRGCNAVFITTNASLARRTYSFLFKEEKYSHFPLLITDHLATNLLWAKQPDKYDDISKQQLLADAYALTNPSDQIWEKYYAEIEKLRAQKRLPDDEALMLHYSSEVQAAIMDVTFGGEIDPSEENIFDIIGRAKERLTKSERLEIEKLKSELTRYKDVERQFDVKSKEIENLRDDLTKERSKQQATLAHVQITIHKVSNVMAWSVISIPGILMTLALLNLVPPPYSYISGSVLMILSLLNLLIGTTLIGIKRNIELRLCNSLQNIFKLRD